MISTKADAIGIIFPNSYDGLVPELVTERLMASIPFAGRYRLCDFMISSMVQSGIDDISLMVRKNYRSLMDHLGSGREWDLARKKGGLNIVPPYSQKSVGAYFGRIEALKGLLGYLRKHNEEYVIITDSNVVVNFNFRDLIKKHVDSGADITAVYRRMPIPASLNRPSEENGELYYSFEIENDFVKKVYINPSDSGDVNFNLNMYILGREKLIELVEDAYVHGATYFARDIIIPQLDRLSVQAYHYDEADEQQEGVARDGAEDVAADNLARRGAEQLHYRDKNQEGVYAPYRRVAAGAGTHGGNLVLRGLFARARVGLSAGGNYLGFFGHGVGVISVIRGIRVI